MRWATIHDPVTEAGGTPGALTGLVEDGQVHTLPRGTALIDLLDDDGETLARAADQARSDPVSVIPLAQARLLPPIPVPPSLRDFYAFEQHVRTARRGRGLEMDPDWYELPVFYFSNPRALVADQEEVPIPPGCSELDFELEVAAVVGRGGSNLTPDQAEQRIAGFCVMNDWSARDLQRREMKLSMGPVKGKDFATSLGPLLVTPDELADARKARAYDLAMTARVNGIEYSRASLADIHYSFGELIAYASRGTTVVSGDVVGSGTCGTGCILELSLVHGSDAYPWLRAGDVVELGVDRLGSLTNQVVSGPPLTPLRPAGS